MNAHAKISAAIGVATLAQLKPGQDYPDGNINARLTYTDAEIDELAASLMPEQDGQLRPFLVATHPKKAGVFYVFGGGRRRLAYERLIGAGRLPKDHHIEIKDHGQIPVEKALSLSLADNQAVQLHPADQAATFARLAADTPPEDIAKARGMTLKAVKQAIALGSALAPEVITAWRDGKLTRELVEVFTIASDFESQVKALNDGLANGFMLKVNKIRRSLMRNKEPEMKRLLGFVGVESYRAAGGEVTEDFFGEGGNVKDMKLLEKLAKDKMAGFATHLEGQGWSWVETQMAPNFMHHGYGRLNVARKWTVEEKSRLAEIKAATKANDKLPWNQQDHLLERRLSDEESRIETACDMRSFTGEQKAKSGVIAMLTAEGAVSYTGGLVRKVEPKTAAKKKSGAVSVPREPEPPKTPDISGTVERDLGDIQDSVLADLIAAKPKDAFALFLVALEHCGWNSAIAWEDINDHTDDLIPGKDFAAAFANLRKLPVDKLAGKLAIMVGKVSNVAGYLSGSKDAQAIVDLVGEKNLQAGLAKRFDPKPYVAGASKQHLLGILAEAAGEDQRKAHEGDGEAKLALPVITAIKATGWLPPMLRTRVYAGPSAKKPAKLAKAKAAKKKAR
jgi:ParB-like chromosome segregation protein Spo0J